MAMRITFAILSTVPCRTIGASQTACWHIHTIVPQTCVHVMRLTLQPQVPKGRGEPFNTGWLLTVGTQHGARAVFSACSAVAISAILRVPTCLPAMLQAAL